ncbi:GGDEF domain-containing protein [Candidatus Kaiserbacteria bacterium]|nr:GGDEF domain-containing protein [Candidatus Kaiserbacteria bacterium]
MVKNSTIPLVGEATRRQLDGLSHEQLVEFGFEAQGIAFDDLTGLVLRRIFRISVGRELLRLEHDNIKTGAMLMVDIDHFKEVNDTCGHDVGDEVLVEVAKVLTKTFRPGDMVSRHGGEEFCVWLPDIQKNEVRVVADRVLKVVQNNTSGSLPGVTISIGIALVEDHGHELDHLITVADKALYVSKDNGRNQLTVADQKIANTERRGAQNDPRSEDRRGDDRRD